VNKLLLDMKQQPMISRVFNEVSLVSIERGMVRNAEVTVFSIAAAAHGKGEGMDGQGVTEKIKKHLLNLVVVGVAVFFAMKIYAFQGHERERLIRQKEKELEKKQRAFAHQQA